MTDRWLLNLKVAFDAEYYRTEADIEGQSDFPWRNKRCGDCPFSMNDVCQVTLTRCSADDVPCAHFDPPEYAATKHAIVG